MKYLVLCEGPNEKAVVEMLIESNNFIYGVDDLIGLTPYFGRKLDNSHPAYNEVSAYSGQLKIIFIGDTMNGTVTIPKEFKEKIEPDQVEKYHTTPELEMLIIINEGKLDDYNKQYNKYKYKPKTYAKRNIEYDGVMYNGETSFWRNYYEHRPEVLLANIKEYHRKKGKGLASKRRKTLFSLIHQI